MVTLSHLKPVKFQTAEKKYIKQNKSRINIFFTRLNWEYQGNIIYLTIKLEWPIKTDNIGITNMRNANNKSMKPK